EDNEPAGAVAVSHQGLQGSNPRIDLLPRGRAARRSSWRGVCCSTRRRWAMGNSVLKSASRTTSMQSGVHRRVSRVGSLLEHPDPGLEQPSFDVDPCDSHTVEVAAALIGTMKSTRGCWSLSAPQLGYHMRVLCLDVTGHEEAHSSRGLVVLANPKILSVS